MSLLFRPSGARKPRLRNGAPRAFLDHRTREARLYAEYIRGLVARVGPLPLGSETTVRELGRVVIGLNARYEELADLQSRPAKRRALSREHRIEADIRKDRLAMVQLERRVEELAAKASADAAPATTPEQEFAARVRGNGRTHSQPTKEL